MKALYVRRLLSSIYTIYRALYEFPRVARRPWRQPTLAPTGFGVAGGALEAEFFCGAGCAHNKDTELGCAHSGLKHDT